MTDAGCPRCGSGDLNYYVVTGNHPDADQASCEDCEHRWGDGYPDSQDRPLPEGMVDCQVCEGRGDNYGCGCGSCKGAGIVALP